MSEPSTSIADTSRAPVRVPVPSKPEPHPTLVFAKEYALVAGRQLAVPAFIMTILGSALSTMLFFIGFLEPFSLFWRVMFGLGTLPGAGLLLMLFHGSVMEEIDKEKRRSGGPRHG